MKGKKTKMEQGIVCNKCGKVFDMWDTQEDYTISTQIGYGSSYDGDHLNLHICCECMDKLISECIVSPIIEDT